MGFAVPPNRLRLTAMPPSETLKTMKFKPVDRSLLAHPVEKRGFAQSKGADIFYRLIPAYGSTPEDPSKPIIVVINGGPGMPSSVYRPLDFDYQNPDSPKNGSPNRFKYLLHSFRVLIADQRGTDGQSVPVDLMDPELDYHAVARDFSSDTQARDYLAVINAVIPADETFYMIAQSYGGIVGMQYLALADRRKPGGIVFSAAAVPHEDVLEQQNRRRAEQLRLNQQLRSACPDIAERLARVRTHLASVGLDPSLIHSLYGILGKGIAGAWEKAFIERLDKMLTQSHDELKKELHDTGGVNLLNYILSSSNFTPGYTDRTMARKVSATIPFEPWMIDENLTFLNPMDEEWKERLVRRIDAAPPEPTPMPPVADLRASIAEEHVLFTAADNDAFVPDDIFKKSIAKYQVEGHTEIRTLPGGHNAIFLEDGYRAFCDWAQSI
jgi:pimeloyl-ACP methyl ester carboxylesterase